MKTLPVATVQVSISSGPKRRTRITSIDALRGLIMFTMIFVSVFSAFSSLPLPTLAKSIGNLTLHWRVIARALGVVAFAALVYLAFAFRGKDDHRIITLSPFSIHTEWYGILGLIGWAYLVAAIVFLVFRGHRTALLERKSVV